MGSASNAAPVIHVYRARGGWVADYTDTPKAYEYLALFGTTALPLPFTQDASADVVLAHARSMPGTRRIGATVEILP